MILSKWPPSRGVFDRFLYAGVGADANGTEVTVLSALARRDLDPWEEAAEMSKLSADKALRKLVAMLETLPGHESLEGRTAVAGRLVSLLPHSAEVRALAPPSLRREQAAKPPFQVNMLALVCGYLFAMVLVCWWFAGNSSTPAVATDVRTPTTVGQGAPRP